MQLLLKYPAYQGNQRSAPSQAGSGAVQSKLHEQNIDQLYENIDQWQKAHKTFNEQQAGAELYQAQHSLSLELPTQ